MRSKQPGGLSGSSQARIRSLRQHSMEDQFRKSLAARCGYGVILNGPR